MTPLTCAQLADLADEVALDALPGDLRSLALDHLERCAPCRALVDDLSETADELLLALAVADPPAGFEHRVLSRIEDERRNQAPRRRGGRRRHPLWAARVLAAAAVLIGVLVAAPHLLSSPARPDLSADGRGHAVLRTVRLVSATGAPAGNVSVYDGRPVWVWMQVDHALARGTYWCVLDVAGAPSIEMGTLTVSGGRGGWGEHVAVNVSDIRAARIVAEDGTTVATASFH